MTYQVGSRRDGLFCVDDCFENQEILNGMMT